MYGINPCPSAQVSIAQNEAVVDYILHYFNILGCFWLLKNERFLEVVKKPGEAEFIMSGLGDWNFFDSLNRILKSFGLPFFHKQTST